MLLSSPLFRTPILKWFETSVIGRIIGYMFYPTPHAHGQCIVVLISINRWCCRMHATVQPGRRKAEKFANVSYLTTSLTVNALILI